jgi:hypothetical protein
LTGKIEEAQAQVNAAGEPDEAKIFNALKNLEEEMAFDMNKWDKKLEKRGDKATDFQKTQALDAKYRYEFVD